MADQERKAKRATEPRQPEEAPKPNTAIAAKGKALKKSVDEVLDVGPRKGNGFVGARAMRARCPLCRLLAGAEDSYVRIVLDYVEDPEFERAYDRSAGLCLPHLTDGLTRYPDHRGLVPLVARTDRKLEALTREVRGFIDKHDYRKRVLFTHAEATSWTRSEERRVGKECRL